MNIIGILVLIAAAICVIVVVGSWVLGVIAATLGGAINKAESGATSFLNFIGRKHLAQISTEVIDDLPVPVDLLELEHKLSSNDEERLYLKNYVPSINPYGPLRIPQYEEQLPKLFNRVKSVVSTNINVEYPKTLARLSGIAAFELLQAVNEKQPPKFPYPALSAPKPVTPPKKWTPWTCSEKNYEVNKPFYLGILRPLNYFVMRSYKEYDQQASLLKYRQSAALDQASMRNSELEKMYQEALKKYAATQSQQDKEWADIQIREKKIYDQFFAQYFDEKRKIEDLVLSAKLSTSEGLISRIEQTLKLVDLPQFVACNFAIKFDELSKILILEHEFPDIGSINWQKTVSLKSGITTRPANQKEIKESATLLYPTLSLRLACEVARLDLDNLSEAIVVNGWSNYIERKTGQSKRAYCSSLFATKKQLIEINLSAADPISAFSSLKGVSARSLELTPIAPILRLNTQDDRFVDAKEILSKLAQGDNIAAMGWEDFEHLCRELFEKAFAGSGAEVKVTQASRDQGVDAVIFDPDVLRGGKIVVQAKRYTNTVDVSAVRDLYGAIINEGATKGILVTTSHYGPDAYGFAKDKPITLLNGEELLGLLQKYGYSFRIDLAEAKRLNAENK
jgi:restriction system protein